LISSKLTTAFQVFSAMLGSRDDGVRG
jgi:hypothetical protein